MWLPVVYVDQLEETISWVSPRTSPVTVNLNNRLVKATVQVLAHISEIVLSDYDS